VVTLLLTVKKVLHYEPRVKKKFTKRAKLQYWALFSRAAGFFRPHSENEEAVITITFRDIYFAIFRVDRYN
jgi:hypothetical protein